MTMTIKKNYLQGKMDKLPSKFRENENNIDISLYQTNKQKLDKNI